MNLQIKVPSLILEITRKCNDKCEHCLRGDAQDINMKPYILDKVFEAIDDVETITFTGGEPSLNHLGIKSTLLMMRKHGVVPTNFYCVTNALEYKPFFINALAEIQMYIWDNGKLSLDEESKSILSISRDKYHRKPSKEAVARYHLYSFTEMRHDTTEFKGRESLLIEGRAAEIPGVRGRTPIPCTELDSIEFIEDIENETIVMALEDTDLYINALGDVVLNCDHSYDTQEYVNIGNVLKTPLVDIIVDNMSYSLRNEFETIKESLQEKIALSKNFV